MRINDASPTVLISQVNIGVTFITPSTHNPRPSTPRVLDPQPPRPTTIPNYPLDPKLKMGDLGLVYIRVRPIGGPFLFIT